MLSILITIYNYNLYSVVEELHKQCLDCNIPFEIITQDDASQSPFNEFNEKINKLSNCSFISLEQNVGLRQNKNLLASRAKYEYLLIIDGDCKIISSNYIKNYLENIKDNDGIYGGRIHPDEAPSDQQRLRWKYGKFMEDQIVKKRLENPYRSFLFNNTLIKKSIFEKVKFDNEFNTYGHDDTLFSFELKKINANLFHINNPIMHNDLDTNEIFYNKMKSSLKNLFLIYKNEKIEFEHSKMILLFEFLKRIRMNYLIQFIYQFFRKSIERNLIGKNPKLVVFNFFRLGYFCSIKSNK